MRPTKRKILCICQAGNCRSVALAWRLKDPEFNCDALACGAGITAPGTIDMLCNWAEVIVVMQPAFALVVPRIHASKVKTCDVGPDRWVNPSHPEIQRITYEWAKANIGPPPK